MRIVSLAPSHTEILFALGAENFLVGRTRYCTFPEEAKQVPSVGGWVDVNYEKVEQLQPDLVLTSTFVQDKVVEELKRRGIAVLHVDPVTFTDVLASFLEVGKAVGKEREAKDLARRMDDQIERIRSSLPSQEKKSIYIEEWHKPPTASGNWVPDMLNIINCRSILPSGVRSLPVTYEQLRKFDPEKIILSWCGFGEKTPFRFIQELKKRPDYGELPAVRNNEIHVLDDSLLNRPGPRLVQGLERLSKIVW